MSLLPSNFKSLHLLPVLLVVISLFIFGEKSYGQYSVFNASYNNGVGVPGAGGTPGALGSTGAAGSYSITNTAFIGDADHTNFATFLCTSGQPGSGALPGNGGSTTITVNLNFSGATTPSASNPIIIKIAGTNNSNLGLINPLSQITVQTFNGATAVGSAVAVSTLQTTSNASEFVITPSGACNSLQIKVTSDVGAGGLLGGAAAFTNASLYYAYVSDPTCNPPTYTSSNITGIALGASVTNLGNAIDNNIATYSTLSFGTLGVGATIYQEIYYPTLSSSGDVATVTMAIPPAALAVGLLGSININTFNGTTSTGSVSYSALLQGTDLLTLLQSGATASISFVPTAPFNRIEISMASVASVLGSLSLYEVAVTSSKPTLSSDTAYACYGTPAVVAANAPATNYELRWFTTGAASDQTQIYTGNTYNSAYNITQDTVVWVAKYRTGCQQGSEKKKIKIRVNPLPTITLGTNPTVCILGTNAILPYSATTNTPTKYSITWSGSYGLSNIVDNTLAANNILINIPVGQTVGVKNATLTVKNANGCISNPSNSMSVTVKNPPVITPPITMSYQ